MALARSRSALGAGMLALLAAVSALAVVLVSRSATPPAPPLAVAQLRIAADQRPINRTDQVIWTYQDRVHANPDDVAAYTALGAAYIQRGRETGDPTYYTKAEAALDAALERDGQLVDALIGKATLANARHQFREGLALGEQARALNPMLARVYGVIADSQIELGMYDAAVETLQQMVDLRPDLGAYTRIAYLRELHGDVAGAIDAMERAVTAGGPAAENSLWARAQLGNLFFARGDLEQAERQYRQALALAPDDVYATAGVARVRVAQGRYDDAIDEYTRLVARMPLPEFVIALGETQEAAGKPVDAAQQYALVRAMQQLSAANGMDTDLELALFEVDHGNDPQAALALARAAYTRRPSITAADTLAWALLKANEPTEARRYAEEALRLGTRDALMLYHAGMIAKAQGDHAAGHEYLTQALAINPHFSPLHALRARQALAELSTAVGN